MNDTGYITNHELIDAYWNARQGYEDCKRFYKESGDEFWIKQIDFWSEVIED